MLAGAAVLIAVAAVTVAIAARSGGGQAAAQAAPASTAPVREGRLSAAVSQDGILTYRSLYTAINHARGTYTELPRTGAKVGCGGVLYRVDDRPVLLLCGTVPAYRALHEGDTGRDVRQLNRALHVGGGAFTAGTEAALEALQRRKGLRVTGALALADAVVLPEAVRIAKVIGRLGGPARAGAPALTATSDTLHVQVNLAPSDQAQVKRGDRAEVTLPDGTTVAGRIDGFGRPPGATYVSLRDPRKARGMDRAPVGVTITTDRVANALSVPVTALVGRSGGGFAVEVVRAGGRRELVPVRVGLFDTAGGRVQVEGGLREGDRVAVPSL